MKTLDQWLSEYETSHRHPTNQKIHKLAVPSITFSLLGLLWCAPVPSLFSAISYLNWCTLFALFATLFYVRLSFKWALMMLLQVAFWFALIFLVNNTIKENSWKFYSAIFLVAWVLQFIGHKIEGKKPSFFKDLLFLLIGPIWVMKSS